MQNAQKVVCPLCREGDIEWVGDRRFLDNWYCHSCGRYFHAPMMVSQKAPSSLHPVH
jgi:transposase-like protein